MISDKSRQLKSTNEACKKVIIRLPQLAEMLKQRCSDIVLIPWDQQLNFISSTEKPPCLITEKEERKAQPFVGKIFAVPQDIL